MRTAGPARRGPRAAAACRWIQRVVPRNAGRRGQRILPGLSGRETVLGRRARLGRSSPDDCSPTSSPAVSVASVLTGWGGAAAFSGRPPRSVPPARRARGLSAYRLLGAGLSMWAMSSNGSDFAGRAVLVTGGTRGIGAGIASAFLAAGADVLVCGRTPPVDETALPAAGGRRAVFSPADVRDPSSADRVVNEAAERFGRLDVVVNNAGGAPYAEAATAPPHVSQAANRIMQAQDGGGSIVMIGSVSGIRPSPGTAAYGAAKAGLASLATSLAVEWAPAVRVNTVVAGPAET